ncbi:MAG TPA: hypothetical protein VHT34_07665 [Clostridia bacterium]|nr:hypothetical protein [Clostridia bacterium]
MNKYWKEKIKFFVLIALVITSIIQVGILWSPAFFPISQANSQKLDVDSLSKLFMPYRVSASDGFGRHWIINKSDSSYKVLWEDAKNLLTKAMSISPKQTLDQSQWPSIVSGRSIVFEFRSDIDINLTAWLLNSGTVYPNGPNGVYKVLVSPGDDYNYTAIYILDDANVYKYNIQMKEQSKNSYEDIISSYQNNNYISSYGMIGTEGSIKPDILGITDGIKVKPFNTIVSSIPKILKDIEDYNSSELLKLAISVLGSDVYSYDRSVVEEAVKFSTVNNMYKIYFDGLMQFTSLQANWQGSKGKVEEAFKNAFKFISKCKLLSPDTSIYLSGIKSKESSYIFYFNYIKDEYPVFIDFQSEVSGTNLTDAITIEANENSVLNCNWVLRDFKKSKETNYYNVSLRSFLENDQQKIFKTLRKSKTDVVTDIIPSYVVTSNKATQKLLPIWVINTTAKNIYATMEKVNGVK